MVDHHLQPEPRAEPMPDFDRPMKIHFRDGVATRVEDVDREGGMRKRTTVTQ